MPVYNTYVSIDLIYPLQLFSVSHNNLVNSLGR